MPKRAACIAARASVAKAMTSPAAIRFEALNVFEQSIVEHVRATMTARYPHTWLRELQSVFGEVKWARLSDLAKQSQANALHPNLPDEFSRLGIAELPELFERQFAVLASTHINRFVLRQELTKIRVERNATVHARGGDLTVADAVELLNAMRRVLRALGLMDAVGKIDGLIDTAFGAVRATPTPGLAPRDEGPPTPETFDRMFDMSAPELFIAPLMRFFQDMADNLYFGSEDEHHPMDERWGWHRGSEAVVLALQDILANGLTMAGYNRILHDALRGVEDPPTDEPADPPTQSE